MSGVKDRKGKPLLTKERSVWGQRVDVRLSMSRGKKEQGGESKRNKKEVLPVGNRHGAHSRMLTVIWPRKAGTALCN